MLLWLDRVLLRWPGLAEGDTLTKTTPRALLTAAVSFALALAFGPRLIAWLRARFREPIKSGSPQIAWLHRAKESTPTMGGIFIVAALVGATLVAGDWSNPYLPILVLLVVALAVLGAYDDLIKLTTAARGMRARTKLVAQTAIALVAATLVYRLHCHIDGGLDLIVPFSGQVIALGWLFVPLAALVIVGSSNAVNLADGLDGLAGGCLVCALGAMTLVVSASADATWARALGIAHIPGGDEAVVVAAAAIGGLLGFLWFNCHPASVFMGNTGALPLGGLLGLLAVIARQELLLVAIGGVFVVEAVSVIAQVVCFRCLRRRVLLCAPVHHHFQLKGWAEDKIVVRFWIAGALCALAGLAVLKVPHQEPRAPQITAVQRLTR